MSPARRRWLGVRPEVVLGWLGVAAYVVIVYAVVVRGGGVLIGRTSSPHLGLSVLATGVVALTIEPVRVRMERAARSLLHGGKPSPYEVLAEFSDRVSGRVAGQSGGEQTTAKMAQVLAEGTAAAWAQVWLLVNGRLTLVATHPVDADARADPPPLSGVEHRDGLRSAAVGHGGTLLGVLRVQERQNRPLTPVEERLFAGLAAQAGLVLHTAKLRAELTVRHNELQARALQLRRSRDELVAAQDQERRRLERDIHDGAQQQLVALGINLRLAQTLAVRTPESATALLREQAAAATDAIETLSTLSRGEYPRALREHGLAEALSSAVATSPVPAELVVDNPGRFTKSVEAAVYFCCLEALQNVAKHAGASAVEVRLALHGELLRLTITDDGSGLDPNAEAGVGLTNMRQRVTALGGNVSVASRPGGGTAVTAVVPALRVPAQRAD